MLRVLVAVLFIAAWSTNAHAVHTVSTCGESCNSGEQCNLGNNIACSTDPGVTLNTGADFDFKGHTITCSGCGSSATGVVVTGSNSIIEDSVGDGGLRNYQTGIHCNGQTGSQVRNVHVDGGTQSASYGILECRKVQNAVITNVKNYGITNLDIGDSDYIKDSYISGPFGAPGSNQGVEYGIWLDGDGSGLIDHNVITNTTTLSILAFFTSNSLVITDNMLFNQSYTGGLLGVGTGLHLPIMSGNVCGDPNAAYNSACADCITAGYCQDLTTPLDIP